MIPAFPHIVPMELAHRDDFEEFVARDPRRICEHAFANLWLWRDFDRPQLTIVDGSLCVRVQPLDEPAFFLEPVSGKRPLEAAALCLAHTGRISRATPEFIASFAKEGIRVQRMRDHDDYVYRVRDLAALRGRRFDGKRNHVKGLQRRLPGYAYRPLQAADAKAALSLFEQWHEPKIGRPGGAPSSGDLEFECQRLALRRCFEDLEALELFGGALEFCGELYGFVIASRLNAATACLHLEYHQPGVRGLAQAIFWEACRSTFCGYEEVNFEQDLGIEGLRRHKDSYYPLRMEEKYDVIREGI